MSTFFFFFVSSLSILVSVRTCIGASYSILAGESLFPNQTIVTTGGFELGFFSPGNSRSYYVGIWYTNIPETVVWGANRNKPIPRSLYNNSRLHLSRNGTLQLIVLSDVVWDTGSDVGNVTEASLVVSGDLVLVDAQNTVQWNSRDHPTDTWLPGGDIGFTFSEGVITRLVSWKNPKDPGYVPRVVQAWKSRNFSDGCRREKPLMLLLVAIFISEWQMCPSRQPAEGTTRRHAEGTNPEL